MPESEESAYLVNLFFFLLSRWLSYEKATMKKRRGVDLAEQWEFLIGTWEREEFVMKGIVAI